MKQGNGDPEIALCEPLQVAAAPIPGISLQYRPRVDGMRAIAILAVVGSGVGGGGAFGAIAVNNSLRAR